MVVQIRLYADRSKYDHFLALDDKYNPYLDEGYYDLVGSRNVEDLKDRPKDIGTNLFTAEIKKLLARQGIITGNDVAWWPSTDWTQARRGIPVFSDTVVYFLGTFDTNGKPIAPVASFHATFTNNIYHVFSTDTNFTILLPPTIPLENTELSIEAIDGTSTPTPLKPQRGRRLRFKDVNTPLTATIRKTDATGQTLATLHIHKITESFDDVKSITQPEGQERNEYQMAWKNEHSLSDIAAIPYGQSLSTPFLRNVLKITDGKRLGPLYVIQNEDEKRPELVPSPSRTYTPTSRAPVLNSRWAPNALYELWMLTRPTVNTNDKRRLSVTEMIERIETPTRFRDIVTHFNQGIRNKSAVTIAVAETIASIKCIIKRLKRFVRTLRYEANPQPYLDDLKLDNLYTLERLFDEARMASLGRSPKEHTQSIWAPSAVDYNNSLYGITSMNDNLWAPYMAYVSTDIVLPLITQDLPKEITIHAFNDTLPSYMLDSSYTLDILLREYTDGPHTIVELGGDPSEPFVRMRTVINAINTYIQWYKNQNAQQVAQELSNNPKTSTVDTFRDRYKPSWPKLDPNTSKELSEIAALVFNDPQPERTEEQKDNAAEKKDPNEQKNTTSNRKKLTDEEIEKMLNVFSHPIESNSREYAETYRRATTLLERIERAPEARSRHARILIYEETNKQPFNIVRPRSGALLHSHAIAFTLALYFERWWQERKQGNTSGEVFNKAQQFYKGIRKDMPNTPYTCLTDILLDLMHAARARNCNPRLLQWLRIFGKRIDERLLDPTSDTNYVVDVTGYPLTRREYDTDPVFRSRALLGALAIETEWPVHVFCDNMDEFLMETTRLGTRTPPIAPRILCSFRGAWLEYGVPHAKFTKSVTPLVFMVCPAGELHPLTPCTLFPPIHIGLNDTTDLTSKDAKDRVYRHDKNLFYTRISGKELPLDDYTTYSKELLKNWPKPVIHSLHRHSDKWMVPPITVEPPPPVTHAWTKNLNNEMCVFTQTNHYYRPIIHVQLRKLNNDVTTLPLSLLARMDLTKVQLWPNPLTTTVFQVNRLDSKENEDINKDQASSTDSEKDGGVGEDRASGTDSKKDGDIKKDQASSTDSEKDEDIKKDQASSTDSEKDEDIKKDQANSTDSKNRQFFDAKETSKPNDTPENQQDDSSSEDTESCILS